MHQENKSNLKIDIQQEHIIRDKIKKSFIESHKTYETLARQSGLTKKQIKKIFYTNESIEFRSLLKLIKYLDCDLSIINSERPLK